jgi:ATP-dependent DNA helicase RecG
VGRNGLESYCFLFTHQPQNARLAAFCRAQNGFEIARLDLKFRQGGDLLDGKEQSGRTFRWLDMADDEAIVAAARQKVGLPMNEN